MAVDISNREYCKSFLMRSLRWMNDLRYVKVQIYCSDCGNIEEVKIPFTNKSRTYLKEQMAYYVYKNKKDDQYVNIETNEEENITYHAKQMAYDISFKKLTSDFRIWGEESYFIQLFSSLIANHIVTHSKYYLDKTELLAIERHLITFSGQQECTTCSDYKEACHLNKLLDKSWRYYPEDTLLTNTIWSHGLATGFQKNTKTFDDSIENFKRLCTDNMIQLCCSDKSQRIGTWGVYLSGQIKVISLHDLWSSRLCASSKERIWGGEDVEEYFVYDKESYIEGLNENRHDHTEVILHNFKIRGIWIKEWFWNKLTKEERGKMNYLREICVKNNMVFHIIGKRRK